MKTLGLIGILTIAFATAAGAQKQPQKSPVSADDIPADYRPPKGMCRIWLKDVPPAQQPAPTDCPSAVKNVPPNGTVIFGEDAKEKPKEQTKDQPKDGPTVVPKGLAPTKGTKPPPILPRRKPPQ